MRCVKAMFAVARDFSPAVLRARVAYRQIAALVLESDAVLHTTDPDFLRCAALRWLPP